MVVVVVVVVGAVVVWSSWERTPERIGAESFRGFLWLLRGGAGEGGESRGCEFLVRS